VAEATDLQLWGAFCFGVVIGWFLYSINRYRTEEVKLADVVTLIGALGGAAVLDVFPPSSDLFGAYGIGLAVGFFGYFLVLLVMVLISKSHTISWFIDGRSKQLEPHEAIPAGMAATSRPMQADDDDRAG
jgi:hypothetical protein